MFVDGERSLVWEGKVLNSTVKEQREDGSVEAGDWSL